MAFRGVRAGAAHLLMQRLLQGGHTRGLCPLVLVCIVPPACAAWRRHSHLTRPLPLGYDPPSCAWLQAREVADTAVGLLKEHNRRTLDVIAARIYFYYSYAYECLGRLADVRRCVGC